MTKFFIFENSHCDHDFDPIMPKHELIRGIVIPNTCVKFYLNWIINESTRTMTYFSKNSRCDIGIGPRTLKHELVQDIVKFDICVI